MLRRFARFTPALLPIFSHKHPYDRDLINKPKLDAVPETGFERVKRMYGLNEYDETSVELHTVAQSSFCGAFIGAAFGGFVKSRSAYLYFIENNQATIFKSTMEAKKKLQDYVTVAFAKGAVSWGWRVGIFTFLFSVTATTISVYRGDTSLVEYIIAGTIAGAIYKANLGMAATLVGAGLGATLSTIGGLLILGILKVTGFSMKDIRRALYKLKESRENQMKEVEGKSSEIKSDPLIIHHDILVQERGGEVNEI